MDPHKGNQLHQRHQDYLLWKGHCEYKNTEQQLIAVKALLCQHITGHRGCHTDDDQRYTGDKDTVDQPLERRVLKQLLKVFQGRVEREPFRRQLDRNLLGFKGSRQNPVEGENKYHTEKEQKHHRGGIQNFHFIFHLLIPL